MRISPLRVVNDQLLHTHTHSHSTSLFCYSLDTFGVFSSLLLTNEFSSFIPTPKPLPFQFFLSSPPLHHLANFTFSYLHCIGPKNLKIFIFAPFSSRHDQDECDLETVNIKAPLSVRIRIDWQWKIPASVYMGKMALTVIPQEEEPHFFLHLHRFRYHHHCLPPLLRAQWG